jgi:hypothetical protein
MVILVAFVASGIGLAVALVAVVVLHGGWEAIAAGAAMLALVPLLVSIATLYAEGDGFSSQR